MIPKLLTDYVGGVILNKENNGENKKTIKSKEDVEAYLDKLKYALEQEDTKITLQEDRWVDNERFIEHTNKYTIRKLFPDESPTEAIKRELGTLQVSEYIHTVKDLRYPNLSDFWVFAKRYNEEDVYIKIRVEIVQQNYIFVMSFHFSTKTLVKEDFPYLNP